MGGEGEGPFMPLLGGLVVDGRIARNGSLSAKADFFFFFSHTLALHSGAPLYRGVYV